MFFRSLRPEEFEGKTAGLNPWKEIRIYFNDYIIKTLCPDVTARYFDSNFEDWCCEDPVGQGFCLHEVHRKWTPSSHSTSAKCGYDYQMVSLMVCDVIVRSDQLPS